MGQLSILSVSQGDIKISFDNKDAAETIRAKRIITDAMRRGYALLVEVDGVYQRALDFDESKGEYVIADWDPQTVQPDLRLKDAETETQETTAQPGPKKGKRGRKRIPIESTNAVGIARSAGG